MRLILLLLTFAATLVSAETASVSATSANVRAGAGTTHAVVGSLRKGSTVEVLETSGDWVKVRAQSGLEGWVNARLLQRDGASSGTTGGTPPARAGQNPAVLSNPAGVAIEHREVSCFVAEEFARVEACVSPADKVARTQVHFRASDTSPWYSVEMRPEGSCLAALLPKPKSTTRQVQYFIYTLDRSFAESARPDGAPAAAFKPKVVAAKTQCGDGQLIGSLGPGGARQVVVSIARSPAGKIIETGATALGSPAEVVGFSPDGIVAAQPGAGQSASSQSAGQGASQGAAAGAAGAGVGAAAAGGLGTPVIVAGAVGGAALVGTAVVVAGGGGEEEASLTGSWSGSVASGRGLSAVVTVPGASCVYRWDMQVTLTQTGNTVSGPGSTTVRELRCNIEGIDDFLSSIIGQVGTGTLTATLSPPSGITIPFGEGLILNGTYTATTIDATGQWNIEGDTIQWTLSLAKDGR